MDHLPPAVDPVVQGLDRAALFLDFDGSLAPIVARPDDARPVPAAVTAMGVLARRCRTVAVVSGRPVAFLDRWFPARVRLAGLYGLEERTLGLVTREAEALRWEAIVADAAGRAAELPPAVGVEDKGLSLTLHYRSAPQLADVVARWADAEAGRSGLLARPAKMSVELHPPVPLDKGDVVRRWSEGADVVLFAGDDAGDLPAFAALRALEATGAVATLGVAVLGDETPPAVRLAADLAVEGPAGLAELLTALAGVP